MAKKLSFFLHFLFFGVATVSCQETLEEETAMEKLVAQDQLTASNLVFEETFEGPVPLYNVHNTGFIGSHSFAVVSNPVYAGKKAARIHLKASDPMISNGTRAEVTVVGDVVQREMWYAFAALFPADGFAYDSEREIISQWHQLEDAHLGEVSQSPATYLSIRKDRFILDTGFNKDQVADAVKPGSKKSFDLGAVTKDTWHEFVFHFVHSYNKDGLIEVWHNGQLMLTHTGGNMYNNVARPKWKLGVYKWKWNGNEITDTRKRILYFDNIRVGNAKASLAEMTFKTPLPTVPANPNGTGNTFTLVNAEKDQDLLQFEKGAIFTLSALGTNRITIRAQSKSKTVASMRFVLKGPRMHTFVDNAPPFSLFGDKHGNYYYGKGLPAGDYTLKVIPYTGPDATGKARTVFSTAFTIKKY